MIEMWFTLESDPSDSFDCLAMMWWEGNHTRSLLSPLPPPSLPLPRSLISFISLPPLPSLVYLTLSVFDSFLPYLFRFPGFSVFPSPTSQKDLYFSARSYVWIDFQIGTICDRGFQIGMIRLTLLLSLPSSLTLLCSRSLCRSISSSYSCFNASSTGLLYLFDLPYSLPIRARTSYITLILFSLIFLTRSLTGIYVQSRHFQSGTVCRQSCLCRSTRELLTKSPFSNRCFARHLVVHLFSNIIFACCTLHFLCKTTSAMGSIQVIFRFTDEISLLYSLLTYCYGDPWIYFNSVRM